LFGEEVLMRSPFSLPVVCLALTVAVMVGLVALASFAAAAPAGSPVLVPVTAMAKQVFAILALSWIAGTLGWIAAFGLHKDGWHRMEWTAFLPFNYGGRNPFDPEAFRK
jgi:hypothetical protein